MDKKRASLKWVSSWRRSGGAGCHVGSDYWAMNQLCTACGGLTERRIVLHGSASQFPLNEWALSNATTCFAASAAVLAPSAINCLQFSPNRYFQYQGWNFSKLFRHKNLGLLHHTRRFMAKFTQVIFSRKIKRENTGAFTAVLRYINCRFHLEAFVVSSCCSLRWKTPTKKDYWHSHGRRRWD